MDRGGAHKLNPVRLPSVLLCSACGFGSAVTVVEFQVSAFLCFCHTVLGLPGQPETWKLTKALHGSIISKVSLFTSAYCLALELNEDCTLRLAMRFVISICLLPKTLMFLEGYASGTFPLCTSKSNQVPWIEKLLLSTVVDVDGEMQRGSTS